jgi:outer membrane protein assembly factor BamA
VWLVPLWGVFVFAASLVYGAEPPVAPVEEPVVDLQITGNQTVPQAKILRFIHTRVGRPFNTEVIEETSAD